MSLMNDFENKGKCPVEDEVEILYVYPIFFSNIQHSFVFFPQLFKSSED